MRVGRPSRSDWETREQAEQFTQRADLTREVARLGVRLDAVDVFDVRVVAEQAHVTAASGTQDQPS
jgi:hypothetical protein